MAINHRFEGAASQARQFWMARKDDYYTEGLAADAGSPCPYPRTSFAAQHWRRGVEDQQRSQ